MAKPQKRLSDRAIYSRIQHNGTSMSLLLLALTEAAHYPSSRPYIRPIAGA
jgi:hypothetical protein